VRLNTRGRYGMQLMAQLACHLTDPKPVGLKQVAAATGLPWRYLEQIAGPLRNASHITGRPGRAGGYKLGRAPERITLRDVIETASGPIRLMDCVDSPEACEHSPTCTSRTVWVSMTNDMRGVLEKYTLGDLAKRPCAGLRETAEKARGVRASTKPPARGRGSSKRWKFMRSYE